MTLVPEGPGASASRVLRRRRLQVRVLLALTALNLVALAVIVAAVAVFGRDWPQALAQLAGALVP